LWRSIVDEDWRRISGPEHHILTGIANGRVFHGWQFIRNREDGKYLVALVQQGFDRLSGPRLKVRPLTPKHPPHVAGVAYRRNVNSSATKNFIAAAKRSATSA
jgi:hypothetical protein